MKALTLVLVKGQQNESLVPVEVLVLHEVGEPKVKELAAVVNVGVVAIIENVGSDEGPLGKDISIKIDGKVVEVSHALGK